MSDGRSRARPARSELARIQYPFPPPASNHSCLPRCVLQDRMHRRRSHRRGRHRPLRQPGYGPDGVLGSSRRPRASAWRRSPCMPQRAPASPYGQPRRGDRAAVARASWRRRVWQDSWEHVSWRWARPGGLGGRSSDSSAWSHTPPIRVWVGACSHHVVCKAPTVNEHIYTYYWQPHKPFPTRYQRHGSSAARW